jgi:hypothetical protein
VKTEPKSEDNDVDNDVDMELDDDDNDQQQHTTSTIHMPGTHLSTLICLRVQALHLVVQFACSGRIASFAACTTEKRIVSLVRSWACCNQVLLRSTVRSCSALHPLY